MNKRDNSLRHVRSELVPSGIRCLPLAVMWILFLPGWATAQFYNPETERPAKLLQVPADPLEYFATKLRVRNLIAEGNGSEAETLAERLAASYPRDGENWFLLARAKRLLAKDIEAASAYREAARYLGSRGVEFLHVPGRRYAPEAEAATHLLAAGDTRAALDLLRATIVENRFPFPGQLYDWQEFAGLQDDPEFLELVGRADPAKWSRDYGWRRDIEQVYEIIRLVNPDYRDAPLPGEFVRRFEVLKASVPDLSDEEIFVGLNRMIASLDQGHTWLLGFPSEHPGFGYLPVTLYAFPDGLFVSNANAEHMDLVGSRLLGINEMPAEEVLRQINQMQSVDGEMDYLKTGVELMTALHVLRGLGVAGEGNRVHIHVEDGTGGSRSLPLEAVESPPPGGLRAPPHAPAPLFLSNVNAAHWEQAMPDIDGLYVQMNRTFDGERESLPAFGIRLRDVLAETRPSNLIIDLRHNGGGNTASYREFLRTVVGFSQLRGTQVYVLIGRGTYSAAANLITDLERLADPIFAGEASSQCCNFYGDANRVLLPYSRISGWLTAVKWNLSHNNMDGRREISPDLPVQLTARDFFSGNDPVLDAVYAHIRSREHSRPRR